MNTTASGPSAPTIGFVGVGRMGANMARRLHDRGRTIAALYDVHAKSATDLAAELKTFAAPTLGAVTERADLIFTVVTDDAAQLAIYSESGDSLLRGAAGKCFINCATLTPAVHVEAQRRAIRAGATSLEACMASSIPQARDGTLFLMCGGERASFDAARSVLADLSPEPRYIGAAGQAAQVKALVNMVMNINTAGLAEGLGLASALGLDLNLVREVFAQTGANSQVLKTDGEDMQNRAHDCYFSGAHAAKDSGIAWTLAAEKGVNAPLAAATKLQYERLVAIGQGHLDKSGIAELTFKDRRG